VHLDEVAGLLARAHAVAVGAVGRDEAGQRDQAGLHHELGDLADAPHVLLAVLRAEAQVAVEPVAHVVAVQQRGQDAARGQRVLQRARHGRLARAAQAGEPQHAAALVQQALLDLARHRALLPGDVVAAAQHAGGRNAGPLHACGAAARRGRRQQLRLRHHRRQGPGRGAQQARQARHAHAGQPRHLRGAARSASANARLAAQPGPAREARESVFKSTSGQ